MAVDDLDITGLIACVQYHILLSCYDLIQLHCENVSWEKATDKIPAEVASYLLGDLVQYLSTEVFLRGKRCLFTLEWPQVPDASEVWNYLIEHFYG